MGAATFLARNRSRMGDRIYAGATVDLMVLFETVAGTATDPTTVAITIKDADGDETTYTYNTDSEVTKDSTGRYTARITTDKPGRYFYRWLTTGTGTVTALEGSWMVMASSIVDDAYATRDYV